MRYVLAGVILGMTLGFAGQTALANDGGAHPMAPRQTAELIQMGADNGPFVRGVVTQKWIDIPGTYMIAVGSAPYEVPGEFYNQVHFMDTVERSEGTWRIVHQSVYENDGKG